MGDGASISNGAIRAGARTLPEIAAVDHHRALFAGEPLVFHCNHYNYWLQHTLRLDPNLGMDSVIRAAAESCSRAIIESGISETGLTEESAIFQFADDCFAELGFGRMGFGPMDALRAGRGGGLVRTPVSHYGQMLSSACAGKITREQNLFDQGFAAGAIGVALGIAPGRLVARHNLCMSLGAEVGEFELVLGEPREVFTVPGIGVRGTESPPAHDRTCNVDEPGILEALAGLDFSGNEEGLIPRFGVVLTRHFANFYNRISFEFVHRMRDSGLFEEAEELLVEAGRRCAFNTFGGIMASAEWDAVIRPQCQTREDWAHGMTAVINALGWGYWRLVEISEQRAIVRIWDDYESTGWLGMYGQSDRPVSYLALGGVEGLMGLIYKAAIMDRPTLDEALFNATCGGAAGYRARQTRSLAQGDPFSEFEVEAV
jgi:hypothetical protein